MNLEQYKWHVFEEKYFIRPKIRTFFFTVLLKSSYLDLFRYSNSLQRISSFLFRFWFFLFFWCFFFTTVTSCLTAFPGVKVYNNFTLIILIFKLLLLPVRNFGKDFRCSLWIPCLLSSPFHPKNTWYTHVTCYADIGLFTRVIILQVVSKENGCLLPFGFPFRKHWCWVAA